MDRTRIYSEKAAIDTAKVKYFYNQQARVSATKMGSVFLGNQEPDILERRNAYCRDYILPMLDVRSDTRVLELGCGIGRWASFLLPQCGFYCGVDFSEEMVREAEDACRCLGGTFQFHCISAVDAAAQSVDFYGGKFSLVILSGILVYLNDPDVERLVAGLPSLLAEHCVIYSGEPVGLGQRLTLRDTPSEALHTAYSAIYRTPEEYLELFAPLTACGFSPIKQEFLPKFGDRYTDTGRHFMILRR